MAYTLEVLVGKKEINKGVLSSFSNIRLVSLKQDIWLIPLNDKLLNELSQMNEIEKFAGLAELPSISTGTIRLAQQLSQNGKVAYLQAEFFGGVGEQTSAGWDKQELLFNPRQVNDAINQALQWLGVLRDNQHDEFDMIELGKYRKTESWAQQ